MKRIGFALWAVVLVLCLAACSTASHPSPTSTISPESKEDTTVDTHTFYLTVEGVTFPATFADNQGAEALADLLTDGPLTLSLEDYGSFEKVGALPERLPQNDVRTAAGPGDVMLYQGSSVVLFYGSNTWSYTKLARITETEGLEAALSGGATAFTLSLQP